jgi:hypothetical protein
MERGYGLRHDDGDLRESGDGNVHDFRSAVGE